MIQKKFIVKLLDLTTFFFSREVRTKKNGSWLLYLGKISSQSILTLYPLSTRTISMFHVISPTLPHFEICEARGPEIVMTSRRKGLLRKSAFAVAC